jgi:hypothetical protein
LEVVQKFLNSSATVGTALQRYCERPAMASIQKKSDAWYCQFTHSGKPPVDPAIAVRKDTTLHELREEYVKTVSNGSIEANTLTTAKIHLAHIEESLGKKFILAGLTLGKLQEHVNRRAKKTKVTHWRTTMLRKVLGADLAYGGRIAKECGHPHFPAEFRELVQGDEGVDLLEALAFIIKPVSASDSPEDVAAATAKTERLAYAL